MYTSNDTAHCSRHNRYRMSCWEGSRYDGAFELVHKKKKKVGNGYFLQRQQYGPKQKHKQAEKGRTPGLAPFRDYSSLSSEIKLSGFGQVHQINLALQSRAGFETIAAHKEPPVCAAFKGILTFCKHLSALSSVWSTLCYTELTVWTEWSTTFHGKALDLQQP